MKNGILLYEDHEFSDLEKTCIIKNYGLNFQNAL